MVRRRAIVALRCAMVSAYQLTAAMSLAKVGELVQMPLSGLRATEICAST